MTNMHEITKEQALNRLRDKVSYDKRIKDLARDFEVSAAFMSMVLAGKKPMNANMKQFIGVKTKTCYFLIEDKNTDRIKNKEPLKL